MSAHQGAPRIALLASSPGVMEVLTPALASEGYRTVTMRASNQGYSVDELQRFLHEQKPHLVISEVSIPYERNWARLQELIQREEGKRRFFVPITTNKRALESLVGPTAAYEIIGKPFDLDVIVWAVQLGLSTRESV